MNFQARPLPAPRSWFVPGLVLTLLLALVVAIAPVGAGADSAPDGTISFDPSPGALVAEEDFTVTVKLEGSFAVEVTDLAAGVDGVSVEVQLFETDAETPVQVGNGNDDVVGTATTGTETGNSITYEVTLDLSEVDEGSYILRASGWLDPADEEEAPILLATTDLGPLQLWLDAEVCEEQPCVVQEGGFKVSVSLVGPGTVFLALSDTSPYELDPHACGGDHTQLPETVLFDIFGADADTALVTVELSKELRQAETNNGLSHYQFCYIGGAPFDDRDGNPAPVFEHDDFPKLTHGPALLPECGSAPCVKSRKGQGGGAQFELLVPTGDPMFR